MRLISSIQTSVGELQEFVVEQLITLDNFFHINNPTKIIWKCRDSDDLVFAIGDLSKELKSDLDNFECFYYQKFESSTQASEWSDFDFEKKIFPEYIYENGVLIWRKLGNREFALSKNNFKNIKINSKEKNEAPNKDKWQDAIDSFQSSSLDKVVLSRKIEQKQSLCEFLNRSKDLIRHESYFFMIIVDSHTAFTSCTPEKLLKIENEVLTTEAIAGTRALGESIEESNQLRSELLNSQKDLIEHKIVVDHISNSLEKFNLAPKVSETYIIELKHVQHLKTDLTVDVKKDLNLSELIKTLHPTPAICGSPQKESLSFIKMNEEFDRGLFSGIVGRVGDKTELAVAIRSALNHKETTYVYAGAGIVKESNSNEEWDEALIKMRNFL